MVGLWNEVRLGFYNQRCRCGFRRNFPIRFGGHRIFLLLDQVDPVVHFANSASDKLEATVEIGKLHGKAPSSSSCIPLPQYKSQVVLCRERLRVIVFDNIAILSSE